MKNRKLHCQIVVCVIITAAAVYGGNIENETVSGYYEKIKAAVMRPMTMADVKEAGLQISSALTGAPAKVVSAVSKANTESKYGTPIDEKSDSEIKQVHAVAGGMVIASGKSKELGLYIKIKHDDAVSIYGNLSEVGVIQSERVQRGEIIGNYDTKSAADFFYELQKNV